MRILWIKSFFVIVNVMSNPIFLLLQCILSLRGFEKAEAIHNMKTRKHNMKTRKHNMKARNHKKQRNK